MNTTFNNMTAAVLRETAARYRQAVARSALAYIHTRDKTDNETDETRALARRARLESKILKELERELDRRGLQATDVEAVQDWPQYRAPRYLQGA